MTRPKPAEIVLDVVAHAAAFTMLVAGFAGARPFALALLAIAAIYSAHLADNVASA